ncbi:Transmembrane emp24 domain-containing protein 5 [Amphibalanus amphitrite]|uniref:Transmembrane emp24 domain-containing protein 5 n=1 Tax=Amphibalanus amphitrite TaxID=1232801 RepID=A0A6A4VLH9_AMPAM|nr:Transmembrane emp24 domain-containing protein 5 [Amphibalanus amphitrite]
MEGPVHYLLLLLICSSVSCGPTELTIEVGAGKTECFFASAKIGEYIDIEYQVIDGGQGDIDINFHLHSPTGRQIVSDYKKSDNAHRRAADEEGDYKACWDNSISRFNNKLVFFEVGVEREDGGEVWDSIEHEFGTEGEVYDIKLQDIQPG